MASSNCVRLFSTQNVILPKLETSNDAELLSEIILTHHNPFHAMESSLQLHGITLSPHLVDQTLLRIQHSSKISLAFFHYSNSLPSNSLSASSYNLIIDILSKVRQFDVAWQLIVQMDQNGTVPISSAFLILVRRLIAAGLTRQAIRAFQDMKCFVENSDNEDDDANVCFLLDTLCKYGYVRVAVEFFNKNKHEIKPNVKMYTSLIYGWCKINRIDMAERFLGDMVERGIEPNVVTYNVLLNGVCRKASLHPDVRFERTIRNAEKVFDEMRMRGIEPDVTSFSIVLHVYSRAHKPQLSLDKLNAMKENGISPTVATYTSVVKCLCSCGMLEDGEVLLGEMVSNGVSPCVETYNCFFKEYRGRKDADGALNLYRKMKEDGVCVPSNHTYNILLGMFMKLGRMEIVKEIWNDIKGPDLDSYTLLIHGLCEKQKWKEACQFFIEMIERGLLPQKGQTPLFPCIFGHEAGGIVESVGEGVADLKPGDHVLPVFTGECKECQHCKSEESNMCDLLRINTDRGVMLSDGKPSFFTKTNEPFHVHKAILSSDPELDPFNFSVRVISGEKRQLAYYNARSQTWTLLHAAGSCYDDLISHEGKFYAVDEYGKICQIDYSNLSVGVVFDRWFFGGNKVYLVCIDGQLLVIFRYLKENPYFGYETYNFQVFMLNLEEQEYRISEFTVFLGQNHSTWLPADDTKGVIDDSICFTDDHHSNGLEQCYRRSRCGFIQHGI
ncbi:hypothetical protein EZV62_014983 [Acer yangbiense]|uniref:Uncharacterized protein n=1 Tax=Acer yangbiense TaxID=1000413 RepID=A0A5C7HU14_9ROSI|nr:hypothetical protein EZV62_014983 [Acer yangbiense]